jgi:DnaK suppressor protein
MKVNRNLLQKCKRKLLKLKKMYNHTLNRRREVEANKEIIDIANHQRHSEESHFFRHRMSSLLPEINNALQRIDNGTYGVCAITGEPIEEKRLLAVPWTRVSLMSLQEERAS